MEAKNRFWAKVKVGSADQCWIWIGAINGSGYSNFWDGYKYISGHRFAYQLHHGTVPEGLHLDHLCRVRRCVNPKHLEAVTHRVNCIRGEGVAKNALKTHCMHGHEFTEENTYYSYPRDRAARRHCRACHRARELTRYHKLRSQTYGR